MDYFQFPPKVKGPKTYLTFFFIIIFYVWLSDE